MGVLDGKVAIITGGASGIGKGMATAVAKEGAGVTITDIQVDLVAATAENLRGQGLDVLDVVADGTKDADVADAVQRTVDKWGRIDMLINCHGCKPAEALRGVDRRQHRAWRWTRASTRRSGT